MLPTRLHLTNESAASLKLPKGKKEARVFDDQLSLFAVRIRASGKKSWIIQYRSAAGPKTLTLGRVGASPTKMVRKQAELEIAKIKLSGNPQGDKMTLRRDFVARRKHDRASFKLVAVEYLEHAKRELRPRSYDEVERHLLKLCEPLHHKSVYQIDRKTIDTQLERIAKSSGPRASNCARSSISGMFGWALDKGRRKLAAKNILPVELEKNPVIGTSTADENDPRTRFLSDEEVVIVWRACGDDDFGKIIRLLLTTGQRRGEVAGITEAELGRDLKTWVIPAARVKNGEEHFVPLTDLAISLLPPPKPDRATPLFGRAATPFSGWSKSKTKLDERIKESGAVLAPWRLHDLRRTVRTGMARLGVPKFIGAAVQNHRTAFTNDVDSTYDLHDYAAQKRDALTKWASHLEATLAGKPSNVVRLPEAR